MNTDTKSLKAELRQRDIKIRELEKLIAKDPLTGLYNRRGFVDLVGKLFKDVQFSRSRPNVRSNFFISTLTVAFFDIDNFKKINDAYGHKIGDQILKYVAAIIEKKVRVSDYVGRWGGEELVAAFTGAGENDAAMKADEIRKAVKSRVKVPRYPELKITLSIGVAEIDHTDTLDELIKKSDEAMYTAKKSGKDRVVRYSSLEHD